MKHSIRVVLTRPLHFHVPHMHDLLQRSEHVGHMAYLGLVSAESEHLYGKVAGFLLIVIVLSFFTKEGLE